MASLPSSPSTTLNYKTCTKHFPLLCTTKLAQSTSEYYFVLESLHKALPSTTLYYKACTKHFPVVLCTTKLAQSTSQYYFVLQSLHKALPSTTVYYKAWTKHFPVLLCTTKLAKSISQYCCKLQSLQKVFPSTTLYYKACTKYFPVLLCTTKLAQSTFHYYFALTTYAYVDGTMELPQGYSGKTCFLIWAWRYVGTSDQRWTQFGAFLWCSVCAVQWWSLSHSRGTSEYIYIYKYIICIYVYICMYIYIYIHDIEILKGDVALDQRCRWSLSIREFRQSLRQSILKPKGERDCCILSLSGNLTLRTGKSQCLIGTLS